MAKGITLICPECIKVRNNYSGMWVLDPKAPAFCSSKYYHTGKTFQMVPMEEIETDF